MEVELQIVVSHCVGAKNQIPVLCKKQLVLLSVKSSLQHPVLLLLTLVFKKMFFIVLHTKYFLVLSKNDHNFFS